MKKVVLLGDSIRLDGYGNHVEKALAGEFSVWQPADNCRYAKYTLRQLHDWEDELADTQVVHWNNGIWDVCSCIDGDPVTPLEHYAEEIVRIARFLKKTRQNSDFCHNYAGSQGKSHHYQRKNRSV